MLKRTALSPASRPVDIIELPLSQLTPPASAPRELAIAAFSSQGLHTEGMNLDRIKIAEDLTRVGLVVSVWDGMTNDGLLRPIKAGYQPPPPTGAFFAEHLAAAVDAALVKSGPIADLLPEPSAIPAQSCASFNTLATFLCERWSKEDQWLLQTRMLAKIEQTAARAYENPYLSAHGIHTPSLYQPDLAPVVSESPLPKGFRRAAYKRFWSSQLNEGKLCKDTLKWIKQQACGETKNVLLKVFKQSLPDLLYGHYVTRAFEQGLESLEPEYSTIYRRYRALSGGSTGAGLIRLPGQGGFLLFVVGDASVLRIEGSKRERYGAFADHKFSSELTPGNFAGIRPRSSNSKPEVSTPFSMVVQHFTEQQVRNSVFTFLTDGFGTAKSFEKVVGESLAKPGEVLAHARQISEELDRRERRPDDRTMLSIVGTMLVRTD